ncbi:hypothetical protein HDV06_001136 [Boothiomyces sp. JEL0866]|nr:hypothetical protein HDV06_001136 [Boothiomyces sp. JEL0866]
MSDPSINTFINVLVGGMVADNLLRQDFSRLSKPKYRTLNLALLVVLQEAIYDYLTEYYYPDTVAMNVFDLIQSMPKLFFWYVLFGTVIQRTMSFRNSKASNMNRYLSLASNSLLYVAIVLRFVMYWLELPGCINSPLADDPTLNAIHDAFDTISVLVSVTIPLVMNALFLAHYFEIYKDLDAKNSGHVSINFVVAFCMETIFNILTFINQIYTAANLDQPMHRISNVAIGIIGINLLRFGSDIQVVLSSSGKSKQSAVTATKSAPSTSMVVTPS